MRDLPSGFEVSFLTSNSGHPRKKSEFQSTRLSLLTSPQSPVVWEPPPGLGAGDVSVSCLYPRPGQAWQRPGIWKGLWNELKSVRLPCAQNVGYKSSEPALSCFLYHSSCFTPHPFPLLISSLTLVLSSVQLNHKFVNFFLIHNA